MKIKATSRGFPISNFKDANGQSCSIQISSAARDEALLWLGCNEMNLRTFVPYTNGWKSVSERELAYRLGVQDVISNTRMHLTQSQVKQLLPLLQKFAETGELE